MSLAKRIAGTTTKLFATAAVVGAACLPGTASAALALSYEETAAGTTGAGTVSILNTPSSYVYSDTFTSPSSGLIGPNQGYGFYDDFEVQITGSTVDAITSTISLSNGGSSILEIDNLSVRLYSASGNTPPVLNTPNGGAIDAWSSQVNIAPGTTGTVSVLPWTVLSSGDYVVEVRGTVSGAAGGSYSGNLNVAAVPLPASWSAMLSGLAVLALSMRRRTVF